MMRRSPQQSLLVMLVALIAATSIQPTTAFFDDLVDTIEEVLPDPPPADAGDTTTTTGVTEDTTTDDLLGGLTDALEEVVEGVTEGTDELLTGGEDGQGGLVDVLTDTLGNLTDSLSLPPGMVGEGGDDDPLSTILGGGGGDTSDILQVLQEMAAQIFDNGNMNSTEDGLLDILGSLFGDDDNNNMEILQMLFTNLTLPQDMLEGGSFDPELLFGNELMAPILAYFEIPGFEALGIVNASNIDGVLDPTSVLAAAGTFLEPAEYGTACRFCDEDFDGAAQFASFSCAEWELFAGFSSGEECSILRAVAVRNCGCPIGAGLPTQLGTGDDCELCAPTSDLTAPDKIIQTLSGQIFCSDLTQLPAVDGLGKTCVDIAQFSDFCGCAPPELSGVAYVDDSALNGSDGDGADNDVQATPITEAPYSCGLCDDGVDLPEPDMVVVLGDIAAGTEQLTCAQVQDATRDSKEACEAAHQELADMLGMEAKEFCGCASESLEENEKEPVVDTTGDADDVSGVENNETSTVENNAEGGDESDTLAVGLETATSAAYKFWRLAWVPTTALFVLS